VLLADDSVAVRDVLAQILSRSPDLQVVATADDEPSLLAAIDEARPDVVSYNNRLY
jgi:two-component system chemotaxis response regulator CheB